MTPPHDTNKPFVSYSINYEDVVLRRLFPGRTDGFFVDVGAQHPREDNDFYGLSQLGWSGINVEPNPAYAALLRQERPRDLTVDKPMGDVSGQVLTFYEVENTGLSTFDSEQAHGYEAAGHTVRMHEVSTVTLRDVLDEASPPSIDVLKVDVEGFEEQVLRGNDWDRWRPSVIVLEVTYPNTSRRRPTGIPEMLHALGYRHILFDNLNDFYAAADFVVPDGATLPPNVFDRFVRQDVARLRTEVELIRASFSDAENYARSLETDRERLQAELATVQASTNEMRNVIAQETRMALLAARVEELADRNRSLVHDTDDLKQETRRLLASASQLRGENAALFQALGPAREIREELRLLARQVEELGAQAERERQERLAGNEAERVAVAEHAASKAAQRVATTDATLSPETVEQLAEALTRRNRDQRYEDAASMLAAMRGSTSWRLTRPIRAAGRLFGRS